jgi:hypothetical protein
MVGARSLNETDTKLIQTFICKEITKGGRKEGRQKEKVGIIKRRKGGRKD